MNALSPWAAAASSVFADKSLSFLFAKKLGIYSFKIHLSNDCLWLLVEWSDGGRIGFRLAYVPGGGCELKSIQETGDEVTIALDTVIGVYKTKLILPENVESVLRFTTEIIPSRDLLVPFWPRDIVILGSNNNAEHTSGKIHAKQVGTRTGLLHFSLTSPKAGAVFYLQNLTALSDYCEQTETSCAEVVGGSWPEIGFSLPSTKDKPLSEGKKTIVSDAFVVFDAHNAANELDLGEQFLNLLARIYLNLPKPETTYQNWPVVLEKGLKDLIESPGCVSQVNGQTYFNAYLTDYDTPPEIMVQLAILLPLLDYIEWSGKDLEIMRTIKAGLPNFFDEKLGTIVRWLPDAEDKLDGAEEQKVPKVMDSWYLHHPLLNLSRLALKGDKQAEKLFLTSLEYAIKVARHFKYEWPVFYHMETFEVIKAETKPGEGGEKDVAGLYAHILLQAFELTNEEKYLKEAKKAAKTLLGKGFELFYQANNTAFGAGALLRLYKITKDKIYLNLSYLALANIFQNVQIWDCNYGYGKNLPTFFGLFPLSDAPYTAAYEEQEVFSAFHDYLTHAEGEEILPAVSLLIAEYIRFIINRSVYYYPPMLPEEMLSDEVKTGEVVRDLWIALEDLHDGWEKSGEVGQEVYGAGNAFGVVPRHYFRLPDEDFMIFIDFPTSSFSSRKGKSVSFNVLGSEKIECRLVITGKNLKLSKFHLTLKGDAPKGFRNKDGNIEYILRGNQKIMINWIK